MAHTLCLHPPRFHPIYLAKYEGVHDRERPGDYLVDRVAASAKKTQAAGGKLRGIFVLMTPSTFLMARTADVMHSRADALEKIAGLLSAPPAPSTESWWFSGLLAPPRDVAALRESYADRFRRLLLSTGTLACLPRIRGSPAAPRDAREAARAADMAAAGDLCNAITMLPSYRDKDAAQKQVELCRGRPHVFTMTILSSRTATTPLRQAAFEEPSVALRMLDLGADPAKEAILDSQLLYRAAALPRACRHPKAPFLQMKVARRAWYAAVVRAGTRLKSRRALLSQTRRAKAPRTTPE